MILKVTSDMNPEVICKDVLEMANEMICKDVSEMRSKHIKTLKRMLLGQQQKCQRLTKR